MDVLLRLGGLTRLGLVAVKAHYLVAIVFDQVVVREVGLRLPDEVLGAAVALHLKLKVILLRSDPLLGLAILELSVHLVMVRKQRLRAKEELVRRSERVEHLLVLLHRCWRLLRRLRLHGLVGGLWDLGAGPTSVSFEAVSNRRILILNALGHVGRLLLAVRILNLLDEQQPVFGDLLHFLHHHGGCLLRAVVGFLRKVVEGLLGGHGYIHHALLGRQRLPIYLLSLVVHRPRTLLELIVAYLYQQILVLRQVVVRVLMVSEAGIHPWEAITVAEVLVALFLGRGGLVCHFALALNSVLLLGLRLAVAGALLGRVVGGVVVGVHGSLVLALLRLVISSAATRKGQLSIHLVHIYFGNG